MVQCNNDFGVTELQQKRNGRSGAEWGQSDCVGNTNMTVLTRQTCSLQLTCTLTLEARGSEELVWFGKLTQGPCTA